MKKCVYCSEPLTEYDHVKQVPGPQDSDGWHSTLYAHVRCYNQEPDTWTGWRILWISVIAGALLAAWRLCA